MRKALVLGVNGQDGGYLAQSLVQRGYAVTGVGRQLASRYADTGTGYRYVRLDLADHDALDQLLRDAEPEIVFHVAAVHGAAGFGYEACWRDMMAVNVLALHALLEHARARQPAMRIMYAGSAKIFPAPWSGVLSETTPYRATCLYSIGKIASLELIAHYRRQHKVTAANLILFNHDSARRKPEYFVPTVARALAAALADPAARTEFRMLDFWMDWSAADEVMDIAIDIAEQAPDQDFVLATGKTWHARAAVAAIFARHGLDYRNHIVETLPRSDPGPAFQVAVDRVERVIGRRPVASIAEIVESILVIDAERRPIGSAPAAPSPITQVR